MNTPSTSELLNKKCVPCEGGTPPMSREEADKYLAQTLGWVISEDGPPSPKASEGQARKISKEFKFKDFKESMAFINKVADLAESEGHHPDIYIFYSRVKLELWTHAIGGLSENDFILAAKINNLV